MISCYGEALVDLIVQPYHSQAMNTPAQACLGGSVFNFCIAAQRQGMQTRYLNALSSDSFGKQFAAILQSEGVQLAQPKPAIEPTSIAVVQLDEKGAATYAFHRKNVADIARTAPEIIANLPPTELLHTGCLMLVPSAWDDTKQILLFASAQGSRISVDANMRTSVCPDLQAYRPCVLEACALAHIVKVSDDDLIALGLLKENEKTSDKALGKACQHLLESPTTELIALTLGERGAWLISGTEVVQSSPPKNLKVEDTVGAGDSFFAALLAYLSEKDALYPSNAAQMKGALQHAIAAASICVERIGCNPATWQQSIARSQVIHAA